MNASRVTEAVVDFIVNADIAEFPEEVIHQGKRCLIDGFGVILAGSCQDSGPIIRRHVASLGGTGRSTVLGRAPLRAPSAFAALANGTAGHAMDFDDTQLSKHPGRMYGLLAHPTIPPLAASLAVGERLSASGAQVLEAFLTGFEVECKIAEAIDPSHYVRGFHTTATIGTLGAAAAAAKLMALERVGVGRAIGLAVSFAAGIRVNFGTMTKPLHAGRAAENGVRAADLAAIGFTANESALDGQWGFFQVLGGGGDPAAIMGLMGSPHAIVDPGVSVKPYPCGVLGHPGMDALLNLVVQNDIRPEQIRALKLRAASNVLGPLRFRKAQSALEAKFCIPFMLSSIAIRRKAGPREFTDEFVTSRPVQEMMDRVETIHDPEIEALGYDRIRSVVEVHLEDGRQLVELSDERYRGGRQRPFSREELHEKFTECAELALPHEKIQRAIELIEAMDELETLDELVDALCAPGGGVEASALAETAV
ncbi:MAG: MmgE/PrpD family protein [Gemmatimonadetes bacterium]|nr:MmgE/PrpD family protein [Gemmatimonadota bacterium]